MGSFDLPTKEKELKNLSGVRYLGIIVSGNGITAFFQVKIVELTSLLKLLEAIARSRIDNTNVSVLYMNKEYVNFIS